MAAANPDRSSALAADPRDIVIARTFDAPRELVFKVWTDPRHVVHWWGPNGFTNTIESMDVRPGGVWRFMMHGPDGTDYPNRIDYTEVVPPERLVYKHGCDTDDGNDPHAFDVIVTFEQPLPGKTLVTMRSRFPTPEARDYVVREFGAIEGGNQTLGRLEKYLADHAATI